MLDRIHEYEKMAGVERDLWWYRALHHRIHQIIFGGFHGGVFRIVPRREQGAAGLSPPYLACMRPIISRDCAQ